MLKFPGTHRFLQFAGYPGYFEDPAEIVRRARHSFPHLECRPQPEDFDLPRLRIHSGVEEDEGNLPELNASPEENHPHPGGLTPDAIGFWPGFCGGGILALPQQISQRELGLFLLDEFRDVNQRYVYGMSLGNIRPLEPDGHTSGKFLKEYVVCVEPGHVPALAVRFGLAKQVPESTVKVTIEHLAELGDDCALLVVPRIGRKRPLRHADRLPEWFATFGVTLGPAETVSDDRRKAMSEWFGDPTRPMWLHRVNGGESDSGWMLAVVNYIADHWGIQERGLDSVHLLAAIKREPGFRRHWTSNR